MAKTVVGLFENASDAQGAQSDLESMGLGADTTTFVRKHEPELSSRLMEAGIPQQDAQLFSDGVGQGNQLIIVQGIADDDAGEAAAVMDRHNVVDITRRMSGSSSMSSSTSTTSSTTSGMTSAAAAKTNLYEGQDMVVPIVEEQLRVGKRAVQGGGVRVRTSVTETPVNEQVTLREETVTIDRRPVDRAVTQADMAAMHDETFEVTETDEEAVVDKQARVVEEVVVRKDAQERTETVQDTVRRTQVDVDQLSGSTTGTVSSGNVTTGSTMSGGTLDVDTSSTTTDEGMIERGASKLGNAIEGATGADLDRDGDVGRRDPRNNV